MFIAANIVKLKSISLKSRIYISHPSFSYENRSLVGELYFVLEVVVSFDTVTAEEHLCIK